jgi:cytochrome P450
MTRQLPARVDLGDEALAADPYPTYRWMRAQGPLLRGGPGQFVVPRYAEASVLLHDPTLSSEFPPEYHRFSAGDGPASELLQRIMLHRDPPAHRMLRTLFNPAFGPAGARSLDARITERAAALLGPALDAGELDLVADVAARLPIAVMCDALGLPDADHPVIRGRAAALGRAFAAVVDDGDRRAADDATVWLRGYLADALDDGCGVLGALVRSAADLGVTRAELVDNLAFLLFAGSETTTSVLGTGMVSLLDHPGELRRLQAEPSLAASAVEEVLRFDAPIQSRLRRVVSPLAIAGRTIPAGRVLILLIGSANRDEARFADPDRLDVTRAHNHHLSFGGGAHRCLGASLGRLESRITLQLLVERAACIEPLAPPVRHPGTGLRAFTSVPLRVSAA